MNKLEKFIIVVIIMVVSYLSAVGFIWIVGMPVNILEAGIVLMGAPIWAILFLLKRISQEINTRRD